MAERAPDVRTQRVRSLRLHVIVALGALLVLIPLNFLTSPRDPWWIYVLMGWLPLVAIHTGWAMELFGEGRDNHRDKEAQRKR